MAPVTPLQTGCAFKPLSGDSQRVLARQVTDMRICRAAQRVRWVLFQRVGQRLMGDDLRKSVGQPNGASMAVIAGGGPSRSPTIACNRLPVGQAIAEAVGPLREFRDGGFAVSPLH